MSAYIYIWIYVYFLRLLKVLKIISMCRNQQKPYTKKCVLSDIINQKANSDIQKYNRNLKWPPLNVTIINNKFHLLAF